LKTPNANSPLGRIAVVCGGTSNEREVSLITGKAVGEGLEKAGWEVMLFDWSQLEVLRRCMELSGFDVVFIGYHGGAGEDGRIQAVLDIAHIPYTGSRPGPSALAMDKIRTKEIFDFSNIPTPKWFPWVDREPPSLDDILQKADLGFPMVIKPACEGSTVGITIASDEEQLFTGIETAFSYGHRILFEEYIPGREMTVAYLRDERLPVVEIKPVDGFYDYHHKYTKGASNYIVPAEIDDQIAEMLIDLGDKAITGLGLEHYGRVDFRLNEDKPYCLEVNSLPGMTPLSLVPMAAKAVGVDFPKLVDRIAQMAIERTIQDYGEGKC